jgi:hypothetical protein
MHTDNRKKFTIFNATLEKHDREFSCALKQTVKGKKHATHIHKMSMYPYAFIIYINSLNAKKKIVVET